MAKFLPALDERLSDFIAHQKMFFTATAPADGRVNLSPKGLDTFRIISPTCVGYLDATGSGNETAAHLLQNGRITFMFCAFDGPPLILRLYARGRSVQPADGEWSALRPHFGPPMLGERQLIMADIDSVQTSCGFGVPLLEFKEHRPQLREWAERKGPEGVVAYRAEKNRVSIDGLATGYKG
ncbi:MAG: pyridoxamine 5'-phosphate oxidase family protein [Flavobacteriales bacterium]|nr:pyridoxamine 5'-phosphate oxidase family protein [Flavobacteriales bacterium]MBK7554111.1 pyridoxamine 5'-phosphate oxidase family protein [Flavobacteriales bacterium]MBK9196510.1 pyridoxamine 5'-phosphate oxidase family protein [Flavobacteriales bacterium]